LTLTLFLDRTAFEEEIRNEHLRHEAAKREAQASQLRAAEAQNYRLILQQEAVNLAKVLPPGILPLSAAANQYQQGVVQLLQRVPKSTWQEALRRFQDFFLRQQQALQMRMQAQQQPLTNYNAQQQPPSQVVQMQPPPQMVQAAPPQPVPFPSNGVQVFYPQAPSGVVAPPVGYPSQPIFASVAPQPHHYGIPLQQPNVPGMYPPQPGFQQPHQVQTPYQPYQPR